MPNWVEGKLKIRGKPEDIKRWVEECLHCYTTNWLGDGAHTELVKGAVRFERDPDSEEMYLYLEPGCRCITDGHEAAGSAGRVQH